MQKNNINVSQLQSCISTIFCRVCTIDSIDGRHITAYCVHECEAVNRLGMRSKRFVFTGHVNGNVQVRLCIVADSVIKSLFKFDAGMVIVSR